MDIFSKNEEDKDIFFKNGEKIRDWGYVDPPLVAPFGGYQLTTHSNLRLTYSSVVYIGQLFFVTNLVSDLL